MCQRLIFTNEFFCFVLKATRLEGNVAYRCFIVVNSSSDLFDFALLLRQLARNGDRARAGHHFDGQVAFVLALHFRLKCHDRRHHLVLRRRRRRRNVLAARRRTRPFSRFRRLSCKSFQKFLVENGRIYSRLLLVYRFVASALRCWSTGCGCVSGVSSTLCPSASSKPKNKGSERVGRRATNHRVDTYGSSWHFPNWLTNGRTTTYRPGPFPFQDLFFFSPIESFGAI